MTPSFIPLIIIACHLLPPTLASPSPRTAGTSPSTDSFLQGQTLRVVFLEGSETVRNSDGTWGGYIGNTFTQIANDAGFLWNETQLSAAAMAQGGNMWTACPIDVSLNKVDICVGALWETAERMVQSSFTSFVRSTTFRLISPIAGTSTSAMENIFIPFSWTLWGCFFAAVTIESLAFWLVERRETDEFDDIPSRYLHPPVAVLVGLLGFFTGAPVYGPKTAAGQLITVGFAFLIVVAGASYTANLAAFLTVSVTRPLVSSLQEAMALGLPVCIDVDVKAGVVLSSLANLKVVDVVNNGDHFAFLASGKCAASVMETDAFKAAQADSTLNFCNYMAVGDPVLAVPIALAVSSTYAHALSFYVTRTRSMGLIDTWYKEQQPASQCDDSSSVPPSMTFDDMSGVFLIAGIGMGASLLVWAGQLILRRFASSRRQEGGKGAGGSRSGVSTPERGATPAAAAALVLLPLKGGIDGEKKMQKQEDGTGISIEMVISGEIDPPATARLPDGTVGSVLEWLQYVERMQQQQRRLMEDLTDGDKERLWLLC